MSADDQQFLDVISSIPNQITKYSSDVAEYVDQHVDKIASVVREQLAQATWIPNAVKPHIPWQAPPAPPASTVVLTSTYERLQAWLYRHKIAVGVVVIATGTVAYRTYRKSRYGRKTRRARKARNGGRTEVVVVAGSPTLPLTRSLALDLERKGFMVFVVCGSYDDELMVQNMSRPDVKPLTIDPTDPPNAGASIDRFAQYLQTPHAPVAGAKRNRLTLASVILIPALSYQTSPIATIPPSSFADLFNTHLLHPILIIQSFLPLLTARAAAAAESSATSTPNPNSRASSPPKVLVCTPSIITSIRPPFHAAEATVCSALSAFTEVLTAELRPLAIPVTHIQLGTFDFSSFTPAQNQIIASSTPSLYSQAPKLLRESPHAAAETLAWPEHVRHAYGKNFVATSTSAISGGRVRGMKGSSLREFHNAVFDVIDGSDSSGVVRVGLGANIYGLVGQWVPRGLVAWMMGVRRVDDLGSWTTEAVRTSSSDRGSPERENSEGSEGEGFVAVHEGMGDSNVWK